MGRLSLLAVLSLLAFPLSAADSSTSGLDLSAMDKGVNPCTNFFQYACGTWRANNPIPADRARWSRFDELQEHNLKIERDILEKAAAPREKHSTLDQQIGDYYAACMDEAEIDRLGVQPIAPLLKATREIKAKTDLTPAVVVLQKDGVRTLFSFRVAADEKNSNDQIANVGQGGLGLPDRDYYLRPDPKSAEIREQYKQHVRAMFQLLAKAEGRSDADAQAAADAVMHIETELAKASLDRVAMRNPDNTYHKMNVSELVSLTPDFNWNEYFTTIGIRPIQTLNVGMPDFFKGLAGTIDQTSLADWKLYLTWGILNGNAQFLPVAFGDEDFNFNSRILRGVKEQQARWKRCVENTDRALGDALGQKFVEVAFSSASKTRAMQLVGEIEKEMALDVKSASWMSPATKDQALTKLDEVTNKIGYPDKWKDYSSVKVTRDSYFEDALRARQYELHRNYDKLGKPVDKSEWGMTPPTVNAYYAPPQNNINFPAGILQPPFYNPKADDAVNYGAIGVVIGHELTHGFDDQGRRYDGKGNLRDWWTADDAKAFTTRADCVSQEYGGFQPIEGVKLNGKLTLGENAADNGGIHLAYMALMDSLAKHTIAQEDGLTAEQQFFLGYAQIWCENMTPESARLSAATNPHSPGEFRVNGVLQNLPEFEKAFACKTGDPMVSTNPCRVW
jgi:endothelin-converting enzyme/putative endopeptidase